MFLMTLKGFINLVAGEIKYQGNNMSPNTLEALMGLIFLNCNFNQALQNRLISYAKAKGITLFNPNRKVDEQNPDLTSVSNFDLFKQINAKDKTFSTVMLNIIREEIDNRHIANEQREVFDNVSFNYIEHQCHETDYGNTIDNMEPYFNKLVDDKKANIDKKLLDEFSGNVRKDYTYSKEDLDNATKDYIKYEFGNDFDNLKADLRMDAKNNGIAIEDDSQFIYSDEAKNMMQKDLNEAAELFTDKKISKDLGLKDVYAHRQDINRFFSEAPSYDKSELNDDIKELNDKFKSYDKLDKLLNRLDNEHKNDQLVPTLEAPVNLPLNYISKPAGVSQLNGLYCVNRIINRLGISNEDYIKDPMKYIREYDKLSSGAYVDDKPLDEALDYIFQPTKEDEENRNQIVLGALDYQSTIDQKNSKYNIKLASNEEFRREERLKNQIHKEVAIIDPLKADNKAPINNNDELNIEFYKNILVAPEDAKLSSVIIGKYYDSKEAKIKENKEGYAKKRLAEFQQEVDKKIGDVLYKIPADKMINIKTIIKRFEALKGKILDKYGAADIATATKEDIAKAKEEIAYLTTAAINVCKTYKVIVEPEEELQAGFFDNPIAKYLASEYEKYYRTLNTYELYYFDSKENHVAFADLEEANAIKIADNLQKDELEHARNFDFLANAYLVQIQGINDDIVNGNHNIDDEASIKEIVNKLFKQFREYQESEIKRLADQYRLRKIPLSFLEARKNQILDGKSIGDLDFKLNDKQKLEFGRDRYLFEKKIIEENDINVETYVKELPKDNKEKPVLRQKDYNTKLEEVNVANTKMTVEAILADISEAYNKSLDVNLSSKERAYNESLIEFKKNDLLLGYLLNSKGEELDKKINDINDINIKNKVRDITYKLRVRTLVRAITKAYNEKGIVAPENLSKLKIQDIEAKAKELEIDVDKVYNDVAFDYRYKFPRDVLTNVEAEFRDNNKLNKLTLDVATNKNSYKEYKVGEVASYLTSIGNQILFNNALMGGLDKDLETFAEVDFFLRSLSVINENTKRLQTGFTNEFGNSYKKELELQNILKAKAIKDIADSNKPDKNPYSNSYNNALNSQFIHSDMNKGYMYDLIDNSFSLTEYVTKKEELVKKIKDLYLLRAKVIKDPAKHKIEYFNLVKDINNINRYINDTDEKITNFVDTVNKMNRYSPIYPNTSPNPITNNFSPEEFIKDPKARAYYTGINNIIRIAKENNINPKELFADPAKTDELINKLTVKIKNRYTVSENDTVAAAFNKLVNPNKDAYLTSNEYKDIEDILDFMAYSDQINIDNNMRKADLIKNDINVMIARQIEHTNFVQNDSKKTFYNLLLADVNNKPNKLVYNNDTNELGDRMLNDNFDGKKLIGESSIDNLTLTTIEANYTVLKNAINRYADTDRNKASKEMQNLVKSYFSVLNDYFISHPDIQNDNLYKKIYKDFKNQKNIINDAFSNVPLENPNSFKEDIKKIATNQNIMNKYSNEVEVFNLGTAVNSANISRLYDDYKISGNLEKYDKYINDLDKEKARLYLAAKQGLIPITYYNEMLDKIYQSIDGKCCYQSRPFTEAEKKQVIFNLNFGDRMDLEIDIKKPNYLYQKNNPERININVDINRPNKNVVAEEPKLDNNLIIENDNPNKVNIRIDLEENNQINKQGKAIDNNRPQVLKKDEIKKN